MIPFLLTKPHYRLHVPICSPASSRPHLLYEEHMTRKSLHPSVTSSQSGKVWHAPSPWPPHKNSAFSSTGMAKIECNSTHFIVSYASRKLYQWKLTWIYCTCVRNASTGLRLHAHFDSRPWSLYRPSFMHPDPIWKMWILVVNKLVWLCQKGHLVYLLLTVAEQSMSSTRCLPIDLAK